MKIMKILHSGTGLLVLLMVLGCMYIGHNIVSRIRQEKAEQEQNTKTWTAQACQNAQEYIFQKYGFHAEIVSTEQDWNHGVFGGSGLMLSDILVRMQYQGKSFDVAIDGKTPNTNGFDSYQTEEILNAVRTECEKAVSGVCDIVLNKGQFAFKELESEPLFSAYFDGENAPELLGKSEITAEYLNTDLSDLQNYPQFRRFNSLLFVSCRSEALLQDCPASVGKEHLCGYYPLYFDNVYEFTGQEENYYQYQTGQYQNIYYYVKDGSPEDVTFSASDYEIPDEKHTLNAWNIKSSKTTKIYIYAPKSEVSGAGVKTAIRKNQSLSNACPKYLEDIGGSYSAQCFQLYPNEEFYFLY